ncbi:MAG: hypothetical protein AB7N80_04850 [Bdellovibrionales bacterium]
MATIALRPVRLGGERAFSHELGATVGVSVAKAAFESHKTKSDEKSIFSRSQRIEAQGLALIIAWRQSVFKKQKFCPGKSLNNSSSVAAFSFFFRPAIEFPLVPFQDIPADCANVRSC